VRMTSASERGMAGTRLDEHECNQPCDTGEPACIADSGEQYRSAVASSVRWRTQARDTGYTIDMSHCNPDIRCATEQTPRMPLPMLPVIVATGCYRWLRRRSSDQPGRASMLVARLSRTVRPTAVSSKQERAAL